MWGKISWMKRFWLAPPALVTTGHVSDQFDIPKRYFLRLIGLECNQSILINPVR